MASRVASTFAKQRLRFAATSTVRSLNPGARSFAIQPSRMTSSVTTIFTEKSYAPIGHYSQAFSANGQIWLAGQIAADPSGSLITGPMADQAHQICKNIQAILEAGGSSTEKVVKVVVYVIDMSQLPEFNEIYNTYFPNKPPRTSMEVNKLPLGAAVEVDVTAVL